MYLVDTNILSAASPSVKIPVAELVDWMDAASDYLFLSSITAAEVLDGIAKQEREGAIRKAAMLRDWWPAVEHLYRDRILPFDLAAANIAGALMDKARGTGFDPGFADVAIAATAVARGLTVLTRNAADFRPLGIALLNLHEQLPTFPDKSLS